MADSLLPQAESVGAAQLKPVRAAAVSWVASVAVRQRRTHTQPEMGFEQPNQSRPRHAAAHAVPVRLCSLRAVLQDHVPTDDVHLCTERPLWPVLVLARGPMSGHATAHFRTDPRDMCLDGHRCNGYKKQKTNLTATQGCTSARVAKCGNADMVSLLWRQVCCRSWHWQCRIAMSRTDGTQTKTRKPYGNPTGFRFGLGTPG
jgi:hypothetical protein